MPLDPDSEDAGVTKGRCEEADALREGVIVLTPEVGEELAEEITDDLELELLATMALAVVCALVSAAGDEDVVAALGDAAEVVAGFAAGCVEEVVGLVVAGAGGPTAPFVVSATLGVVAGAVVLEVAAAGLLSAALEVCLGWG